MVCERTENGERKLSALKSFNDEVVEAMLGQLPAGKAGRTPAEHLDLKELMEKCMVKWVV